MKLLTHLEKTKSFWVVFGFCVLFFLLRFPSLFEPYWYGDEGIYQAIGFGLRSGRQFYTGVWDNKPPMLFIIYALTNGDQFIARFFSLLFGISAVVVFYLLSRKLFRAYYLHIITTSFFTLFFGLPTIEGNIANSENFMLFPIILSAYLLYPILVEHDLHSRRKKRLQLFLAGIILSFSFLIKIVTIFDFAAFLVFAFFMSFTAKAVSVQSVFQSLLIFISRIGWFIAGFASPVLLSFLIFYLVGVLPYYLDAAFSRNVDYVGWANHFIIPQGLLYVRMLMLSIFILILFLRKGTFTKRSQFILIWLAFSLFNIFFSNRPYTHYQLLLLPSFSLLIGFLFKKMAFRRKMYAGLLVVLVVLTIVRHFHFWGIDKTSGYYRNYIDLLMNKKDFVAYQSFFDKRNPKDYAIASFIKRHTNPKDVIFLWGNSSFIYPMTQTLPPGRYAAAYHIGTNKRSVTETEKAIKKTKPKYIIITPDEQYFPFDLSDYSYLLTLEEAHIYERTF